MCHFLPFRSLACSQATLGNVLLGTRLSLLDLFRSAQQQSNPVAQPAQLSGQPPGMLDLFLSAQQLK